LVRASSARSGRAACVSDGVVTPKRLSRNISRHTSWSTLAHANGVRTNGPRERNCSVNGYGSTPRPWLAMSCASSSPRRRRIVVNVRGDPCVTNHRVQSPMFMNFSLMRLSTTRSAIETTETPRLSMSHMTRCYANASRETGQGRDVATKRTADFVRRLADPDPAVLERVREPDATTIRILDDTLEQAELIGIRRTTMEDVARRSGVGRATLYRRFPTKDILIDAVVLAEARRYLEGIAQARGHADTLEDRLVYGTVFTVTFLREHTLLKKLLRTEPETILPSLTIDAGAILDFATDYLVSQLRVDLYGNQPTTPDQERHLRTVAELHTRITLSFIATPHTGIKLATLDDTREYVQTYLVPMIATRQRERPFAGTVDPTVLPS
jgi:AcrR family transcriptional regulator